MVKYLYVFEGIHEGLCISTAPPTTSALYDDLPVFFVDKQSRKNLERMLDPGPLGFELKPNYYARIAVSQAEHMYDLCIYKARRTACRSLGGEAIFPFDGSREISTWYGKLGDACEDGVREAGIDLKPYEMLYLTFDDIDYWEMEEGE